MADARGRGFKRGNGRWHARTPAQAPPPRRVERLSDHGWEDRGEETPEGKAVFVLDDFARIWRGEPGGMPWQGEVLVEGEDGQMTWEPFEAGGQLAHMTERIRAAAGKNQEKKEK